MFVPHLLAAHAVPNAVASQDHEPVLAGDLHRHHVRLGRDHLVGRGQARVGLVLEVSDGPRQVKVAVNAPGLDISRSRSEVGGRGAGRNKMRRCGGGRAELGMVGTGQGYGTGAGGAPQWLKGFCNLTINHTPLLRRGAKA